MECVNKTIKMIEDGILLLEAKYIKTKDFDYMIAVNRLEEVIKILETLEAKNEENRI